MHVVRIGSLHELPGPLPEQKAGRFDAIGGMQTHTSCLTRELARRGVTQTVLTARSCGPRLIGEPFPGVTVHRLGAPFPVFRQLWSLDALTRFRHLRPNLVHVHQGEDVAALPLGLALARRSDVPLVVTVHCSMNHTIRPDSLTSAAYRMAGSRAEQLVLPRASAVIALTPQAATTLSRWVPDSALHVIPSGVDLPIFQIRRPDPLPHLDKPRIMYLGRLAPQKGVETLLEAFGLLEAPTRLILVGDGPRRTRLEAGAGRSSGRDRIHFIGAVAHPEVPSYLQHADVLALPSRHEELGSVLLEAQAVGLPIVASRVGGIPSVVRDGTNGVLVPPGDPPALASALDRLLADPSLRQRLGEEGRKRAERYAWTNLAGQVEAVYRTSRRSFPTGPTFYPTRGTTSSA